MNLKGKLAIAGQPIGSGGASSWDDLTGKPFSTVDTESGLTIQDDTLMIDTLDHIATIDYVDEQIAGISTTVDWDDIEDKPTFATVATSGDYDDLQNKPTIPTISATAGLTTGVTVGRITINGDTTTFYAPQGGSGASNWSEVADKPFETVNTSTGLTITSGILSADQSVLATKSDIPDVSDFITANALTPYAEISSLTPVAFSGDYNDLSNKPSIPTVPTNVSDFNNDAGYITSSALTPYAQSASLASVATSGSYNDLSNKPTIPTIPTNVSAFTNDSGYITASALTPYVEASSLTTVAYSGDYDDLINKPTIPEPTSVTVTQTLSSGTEIGQIDVDGTTTVLYAPSGGGGGSTAWTDITGKPAIASGTGTGSIIENSISGNDVNLAVSNYAHAEGIGTVANGQAQHVQGKYNVSNASTNAQYADVIGNGTSFSSESNAEATDWNGNKYLAGDVYTHVTDWANPITNSIKLEPVSITNTLSTGTAIADVEIGGVTTTLYAPAGGGGSSTQADWAETDSTADSYIQNKPNIYTSTGTNSLAAQGGTASGTNSIKIGTGVQSWRVASGEGAIVIGDGRATGQYSVHIGNGTESAAGATAIRAIAIGNAGAFGNQSIAIGTNIGARGPHEVAIGEEHNQMFLSTLANYMYGQGLQQYAYNGSALTKCGYRGYFNKASNGVQAQISYLDILGNGTGAQAANRNNAEATDWSGNKYLAGDIYTNVTDWTNPQANSIKLANIPAPPTTDGTYTLQAVVSSGTITYSWI